MSGCWSFGRSAGEGIVCGDPNSIPSAATSSSSVRSVATSTIAAGAGAQKLFFTRSCAIEFALPAPFGPHRSSIGWCSASPPNGSHRSVNEPEEGGGLRRGAQATVAMAIAAAKPMRMHITMSTFNPGLWNETL